jgi:hypothetical protein
VVVPHQSRGRKRDPPAFVLESPADVDVIACAQENRIESADGQQGIAPHGEVAARNVLRVTIVEHHVTRRSGGARDTLREPPAVRRHDVRTTGGNR